MRFEPATLCSGAVAGASSMRDYAHGIRDRNGLIFGEELQRIGYKGDVLRPLPANAYLELHIEQGLACWNRSANPWWGCRRHR
ncbi:MAG: hypothetical protein R2855_02760 [Thermomicrobiales bacterium]